jgi:hypothetical protein
LSVRSSEADIRQFIVLQYTAASPDAYT